MECVAPDHVAPPGCWVVENDAPILYATYLLDVCPRPMKNSVRELVVLDHVAVRLVLDANANVVGLKSAVLDDVVAGSVEIDRLGIATLTIVAEGQVQEVDEILLNSEGGPIARHDHGYQVRVCIPCQVYVEVRSCGIKAGGIIPVEGLETCQIVIRKQSHSIGCDQVGACDVDRCSIDSLPNGRPAERVWISSIQDSCLAFVATDDNWACCAP